jgi:hypothetical protein
VLLSDCKVYFGGYDLTASLNQVTMTAAKAELGDSRFGDGHEAYFPGLQQVTCSGTGFFSSSAAAGTVAGEPDPGIFAALNTYASGLPVVFAPPNAPAASAGAFGNIAYMVVGGPFQYDAMSGEHGQLLGYTFGTKPGSGYWLSRQSILFPKTAISATTQGTGLQLGTLDAGETLVASLHVFVASSANYDITIESDDNSGFSSATTRATFANVTGVTHQVVKVAGPVATDDYWRAVLTRTGGSITAAVTLSLAAS